MDRQPRSTISKEHAQREAQRAKKLSLNPSKAEVAALWERPIYHGPSALRNWVPSFVREHGTSQNLNDAWRALPPDERAPYLAMSQPYLDNLAAEVAAFNARIPVSPSVPSEPASDASEDDEMLEERRGAQRWNRYRRDHPKACGGAVTSTPVDPFPFFDVPIELRRRVYGLVLGKGLLLRHEEADGSADGVEGPIDVRLFAVSKIMREEAMGWFFENHIFAVEVGDNGLVGALPLFMRKYADGREPWPVEKLKRVHVTIKLNKSIQLPFIGALLNRVCEVLTDSTYIAEIMITLTYQKSSYTPTLDEDMGGQLESFSSVKGVSNVDFTTHAELWPMYQTYDVRVIGTEKQNARIDQIMMNHN